MVQQLAAKQEWDNLQLLLQPVAFDSLKEALDGCSWASSADFAEPMDIRSAVLSRAEILVPADGVAAGTCHLSVRFAALQQLTLHDLMHGDSGERAPRLQESTWTFEGVVSGEDQTQAQYSWQVRDIEWQVWEVKPANDAQFPGWPSHGP